MNRFGDLMADPPDVLVVGGGGAGAAAACEAAGAGATVAVVEATDTWGGATAISGGGCFLVGTRLQRDNGIDDTPESAYDDWIAWGGEKADAPWVRFYVESCNRAVFSWAESIGVTWDQLQWQEGNRVPRWTRPQGMGASLYHAVAAAARAAGARAWHAGVALEALAISRDGGPRVTLRDRLGGEACEVAPRAVVVATGGYMSNRDLIGRYRPDLLDRGVYEGSAPGAQGEGHLVLEALGARFANLDQVWMYVYAAPDHNDPTGRRGLAVRGVPDWIWVNQDGVRFHNEDRSGGATGTPAVLAQRQAWAIFDGPMAACLTIADPYYRGDGVQGRERIIEFLHSNPAVHCAATPGELAQAIGVDPAALTGTLDGYRARVASGELDPQGRSLAGRVAPGVAPLYAMELAPLARKSLGGVVTDLQCRVLDTAGMPIPGVYAAGEVAGMAGGHINGARALEGTMLGPSLFSGRVAGAWAAAHAGYGAGFAGEQAIDRG